MKYKQEETLKRAYFFLTKYEIKPKYIRMDCGSFDRKVISMIEENSKYFFFQAPRCDNLNQQIKEIDNWEDVEIGFKKYQVAPLEYSPFRWDKTYRYVINHKKK